MTNATEGPPPRHGTVRLVVVPDRIWDDFVTLVEGAGIHMRDTAGDQRDWHLS